MQVQRDAARLAVAAEPAQWARLVPPAFQRAPAEPARWAAFVSLENGYEQKSHR